MSCLNCKHEHLLDTGRCERCPCVWEEGSILWMEARLPLMVPSDAELQCARCGDHSQGERDHFRAGVFWGASLQREQDYHKEEKA